MTDSLDAGTKPALASTGVWGGIIAAVGGAIEFADKIHILPDGMSGDLTTLVAGVVTIVGAGLAIYGRITATHKIG